MQLKDEELKLLLGKTDKLLEDAAYQLFLEFMEQNPVVVQIMTGLSIREPEMGRFVKAVWNKGYACGFVAAVQCAAQDK